MPMSQKFSFFFLFLFAAATAQNNEFKEHVSNFNMTSFTYKHNKKWSVYVEVQQRSIEDFMLPDYYEIKGGPAYNFNKQNQVLLGVGRYGTYRESKFYQREIRLWLQYVFSHNIDRVKFDHRFRAEKRFFHFPQDDTNTNDERYRYRLAATVPLNKSRIEPGTIFFNTFEEVFFGPKNPDTFKRNRFFGGFGYQLNDFTNTNIGYMWQKEYSSVKGDKSYHFVYFGLNFTFDRLKNSEQHAIPVAD